MATHVSEAEVQQWIRNSRLTITVVDPELENSAYSRVAATLAQRYETTTWVDEASTPDLIRSIISMLVAAWEINRGPGAETMNDVDSYGEHLESSALALLGSLADGSILLEDDDSGGSGGFATGQPIFFPTDVATTIAAEEGINADGAAQRAFTMGQVF
jgi:hypothetical protein